ncbi:hypothetical protein GBA52_015287 [Prunus armeniaca]|nr:hypothetical protein GBA52_015287 [Prunus armeniaca]
MAKSAKIARIEALEKDLEVALSAAQTKRIETLEVKISELENHLAILPSSSDRPTELEASQSDAFEFFTDNVKETVNTLQNDLQELNAKSSHRYALLLRGAPFFSDIVDRSFSLIEELAFE